MSQVAIQRRGAQVLSRQEWMLAPIIALYGALFFLPIVIVFQMATERGWESFETVLSSRVVLRVVDNTLTISLTTTVVTVFLGYILAALLWKTNGWKRLVVLGFVLLPFWTSVLIKNFAWAFILQDNGVINMALRAIGVIDGSLPLLHNRFAVIVGMVHYSLPYAVFPIYTSMLAIDPRLERAARSLGASFLSTFWHVTLPLTRPGVYASALLIFIVASSFYVTPVILGGPRQMMIANLVDYYTHTLVDFSAGAALSIIILLAASILIAIYQFLPKEGQHG